MKALAIRIGNNPMCCKCALDNARESGYPYLFIMTCVSELVYSYRICNFCEKSFGSPESIEAACELEEMLKR